MVSLTHLGKQSASQFPPSGIQSRGGHGDSSALRRSGTWVSPTTEERRRARSWTSFGNVEGSRIRWVYPEDSIRLAVEAPGSGGDSLRSLGTEGPSRTVASPWPAEAQPRNCF